MAKRFCYVCAGLLLLMSAYALGTQSAKAQGVGQLVAGSFDPDTDPCGVDASGQLWVLQKSSHQNFGPFSLPRSGPIVEITATIGGESFFGGVLYENGDAYYHEPGAGWYSVGNVLGAYPTGSLRQSWGQLKTRYR